MNIQVLLVFRVAPDHDKFIMKPRDNGKYLAFSYEGFSSYIMPYCTETAEMADYIRNLHKERLHNAGYAGYTEAIDDEYHVVGTYIYITYKGVIALAMRINDRDSSARFPFEMGCKRDGTQYQFTLDIPAVDMNTFCLDRRYARKALPLLFATGGKYLQQQGIRRGYGLADIRNKTTVGIYCSVGLNHSNDFSEPVLFESFTHQDDGTPVAWCVLEWPKQEIAKQAAIFDQKYAPRPVMSIPWRREYERGVGMPTAVALGHA